MGTSGSGKSTLLNIIGFMDKASCGEYYFNGVKIDEFSNDKLSLIRNKNISFIF